VFQIAHGLGKRLDIDAIQLLQSATGRHCTFEPLTIPLKLLCEDVGKSLEIVGVCLTHGTKRIQDRYLSRNVLFQVPCQSHQTRADGLDFVRPIRENFSQSFLLRDDLLWCCRCLECLVEFTEAFDKIIPSWPLDLDQTFKDFMQPPLPGHQRHVGKSEAIITRTPSSF